MRARLLHNRASRWKLSAFAVLAVALTLLALEAVAQLAEGEFDVVEFDARSNVSYQQTEPGSYVGKIFINGRMRDRLLLGDGENVTWGDFGRILPAADGVEEKRILVLGGSAVAGWGVAPTACFSRVAQNLLNAGQSRYRFTILNGGRTGCNMSQLLYNLRTRGADLRLDGIVLISGNNEFLDLLGTAVAGHRPRTIVYARELTRHSSLARWLVPARSVPKSFSGSAQRMDLRIPRDSVVDAYVTQRIRRAVAGYAEESRRRGASLLVSSVAVNQQYPDREFDPMTGPGFTEDFVRASWAMKYGTPAEAVEAMDRVLRMDPKNGEARLVKGLALRAAGEEDGAAALFRGLVRDCREHSDLKVAVCAYAVRIVEGPAAATALLPPEAYQETDPDSPNAANVDLLRARWFKAAGDVERARALCAEALDNDQGRNRAGSLVNNAVRRAAEENHVPFFDLARQVADIAPDRIPGNSLFYDYCHYNPMGHLVVGYLLAAQIADWLGIEAEIPDPETGVNGFVEARIGLDHDRPDLRDWASLDFDALGLVRGVPSKTVEQRIADLNDRMKDHPEQAALARVFIGNYYAAFAWHDPSGRRAREQYEEAARLDPAWDVPRKNLRALEELR